MKILVVDDEAALVELVAVNLEFEGYEVIRACDGEEGLMKVLTDRPDLVVLDVRMPGIDGFEVCRRLKGSPVTRDTPIIMVSAFAQQADIQKGLDLGAAAYIKKPFDVSTLLSVIKKNLKPT